MALKRTVWVLASAVLLCAAGSSARAVTSGEVIIDENGHGFFQDALGNAPISLPATQMLDPLSGITNALAYNLSVIAGAAPVAGDLELIEPPTGGLSDIVRFETISGVHYMFFYSDGGDGIDSLADTTLLTQISIQGNNASVTETGLTITTNVPPNGRFLVNDAAYVEGGVNGYRDLAPASGQPGNDTGFKITNYYIVSDGAVPEPASLGILGIGAAALLARRKRS